MSYCGRFAPTPSGPLHLGSLLTALASYLQARSQSGQWLIRMDDLDEPRNVKGADSEILHQLESHGLYWDSSPRYQSAHLAEYTHALRLLQQQNLLYPCICTRADLADNSLIGPDGPIYCGTCRALKPTNPQHSLRIRVHDLNIEYVDGWQGRQHRNLIGDIGDFVVQRNDGQIAYQLACAVDESAQGISEVVRGSDLLGSTFRQRYLQQILGAPSPQYRHLPVLVDANQRKLSKQNHAAALTAGEASNNLMHCLQLLAQKPPPDLSGAPPQEIIDWAITHWHCSHVPEKMSLKVE